MCLHRTLNIVAKMMLLVVWSAQYNFATTNEERMAIDNSAESIRNNYRNSGEYGTGDGNTVSTRVNESLIGAALAAGGTAAMSEGPLPFGDIAGGLIIGITLIAEMYIAQQTTETLTKADKLTNAVEELLRKSPNDTIIYRYGGTNPGNSLK